MTSLAPVFLEAVVQPLRWLIARLHLFVQNRAGRSLIAIVGLALLSAAIPGVLDRHEPVEIHDISAQSTGVAAIADLGPAPPVEQLHILRARTAPSTTVAPPAPPIAAPAPEPVPAAPPPIIDIIRWVFGPAGDSAIRVANCESSLNPGAVSSGGANHGLFQINNVHAGSFSQVTGHPWSDRYDPYLNSVFAKWMYDRSGWGPWGCSWAA